MKKKELQQLTPPISIEKIDIFRDGGSIGVEIIDSSGMIFIFSVDGRISSNTLDHLYINAYHPTREGAKLVSKGAQEGKNLINLLQSYLDDNCSKEEQAELLNAYGKRKLSEEERIFALIINAIGRIKNPRGK